MRAGFSDVRDERGYIVGFAKYCGLHVIPAELSEAAVALRSNPAILADRQHSIVLLIPPRSISAESRIA